MRTFQDTDMILIIIGIRMPIPPKQLVNSGENIGHILSSVAGECLSLGSLCFETRFFEIVTCAELFLEIYNIFENYEPDEYEGCSKISFVLS